MSCGILSLLTNVTVPPTWMVSSFGPTPFAVIVTTGGTAAGGAGGDGAVGPGDGDPELPPPHAAATSAITPAEISFDRGNRRGMVWLFWREDAAPRVCTLRTTCLRGAYEIRRFDWRDLSGAGNPALEPLTLFRIIAIRLSAAGVR